MVERQVIDITLSSQVAKIEEQRATDLIWGSLFRRMHLRE